MLEFLEERFPTDVSLAIRGGPEFSTTVSQSIAGYEFRNANWLDGRNKYQISKSITNSVDLEKILSFFRLTLGKAIGFRFKDHSDFKVVKQFLGKADGKTKTYQLFKLYKIGEYEYKRKITKPVQGTVKLSINNLKLKYSIDYSKGVVYFIEAVPQGVEIFVSFEFDVPVRFNDDYLELVSKSSNTYAIEHLELIELKL
jgi:uncharacterized protein (TIGR02217 family)